MIKIADQDQKEKTNPQTNNKCCKLEVFNFNCFANCASFILLKIVRNNNNYNVHNVNYIHQLNDDDSQKKMFK